MSPKLETIIIDLIKQSPDTVILETERFPIFSSEKFLKKYPKNIIRLNTSIAHIINTAAGLAHSGKIPCVFLPAKQIGEAYNTIKILCANKQNVKIIGMNPGLKMAEAGAAYFSLDDIALTRLLPNIKIFSPAEGNEGKEVLEYLIKDTYPAYMRLWNENTPAFLGKKSAFHYGKTKQLMKGNDITVLVSGNLVKNTLMAAEILREKSKIKLNVIHIPTLKPIDENKIVKSALTSKILITIEEHKPSGGLFSIVSEIVCEKNPVKLYHIGVDENKRISGPLDDLYEAYGLNPERIAGRIEKIMKEL